MRYSDKNHKGAQLFGEFLKKHTLPGNLLDVGCGNRKGYYLEGLKQIIYGIDPELEKETRYFKKTGAEGIPFRSDMFDNIVFATSLDHIEDLDRAYVETMRTIKISGRIFVWNRVSEKLKGHERVFTEKELENLFPILLYKEDHRDITEGMFFCYEL